MTRYEPAGSYRFEAGPISGTLVVGADRLVPTVMVAHKSARPATATLTDMGFMITAPAAHVYSVADEGETTAVVFVPRVNVEPEGAPQPFHGFAFLVEHKTSIGGPSLVLGALDRYQNFALSGTAERRRP